MMHGQAELIQLLNQQGWAVSDTVLPPAWHAELGDQARALWAAGAFTPGEIGRSETGARQPEIRGDAICWLRPGMAGYDHPFLGWMAAFRTALNDHFSMGLRSHEFHFARYGVGKGYQKHIDQHRGTDHRKVSVVFYLNPGWDPANGGELSLYQPRDPDAEMARIAPLGGRLIVFVSGVMPHAVRPCKAVRWSLTGWLRTDDVGGATGAPGGPAAMQARQA